MAEVKRAIKPHLHVRIDKKQAFDHRNIFAL